MTHLDTETDLRAWLAHLELAERAEAFWKKRANIAFLQ